MITYNSYFYFPLFIFLATWTIVFAIFQVTSLALFPVHSQTIFILTSSILAVVMGFFFYRLFFMSKFIIINKEEVNESVIQINYRFLFYLLVVINLIIVTSLYYYVSFLAEERGSLIKYFTNPIMSRKLVVEKSNIGEWNILFAFSSYGVSFITLSGILSGVLFTSKNKCYQIFSLLVIIFAIANGITNFSRNALIIPILNWSFTIIFISFWLKPNERKRVLKNLLIVSFLSLIIIYIMFYIIVSLRQFTASEKEIEKTFIEQLNYYIIGNVVGLDVYLYDDIEFLWGAGIFRSILKWFSRFGLMDAKEILGTNYSYVKISPNLAGNTYSYIRPLYEDFGIAGLLIFSFSWGMLSAWSIQIFLNRFNFTRLYLIVLISFSLCMSFFGFKLINISTIMYMVILFWMIDRFFKNRIIIRC